MVEGGFGKSSYEVVVYIHSVIILITLALFAHFDSYILTSKSYDLVVPLVENWRVEEELHQV